jgi:hypothetical protein
MKPPLAVSMSLLTLAFNLSLAKDPTDEELKDWMTYVRSAGTPTIVELCTPIVANKEDFTLIVDDWLRVNGNAIARGKEVALSGLPKGQTLDEFNAAMIADFKNTFSKESAAQKTKLCAQYIDRYKLSAKK